MNKTQEKIASGLEDAFARSGFAEIGVDGLRDATQVSLRTLYKYCPSREAMVIAALEHRHTRYLHFLFDDLPEKPSADIGEIFDRIGRWMSENSPRGCLFHSAVAAHPESGTLLDMLQRYKSEVSNGMVKATGLTDHEEDLILLHEGITQSWPLLGEKATARAKALIQCLLENQQ